MMNENMISIGIGFFLVLMILITSFFVYLEEKRKCKHKWEETERIRGKCVGGWMVTEVHLKCIKCGDVKKVSL